MQKLVRVQQFPNPVIRECQLGPTQVFATPETLAIAGASQHSLAIHELLAKAQLVLPRGLSKHTLYHRFAALELPDLRATRNQFPPKSQTFSFQSSAL